MKLSNIRIGARLGSAFAMVLALTGIMMIVGVMALARINDDNDAMRNAAYTHQLAEQWLGNIASNTVRTYARVKSAQPADAAFFEKEMKGVSARITAIQQEIAPLITRAEGKRLFAEVGAARKTYAAARDAAFAARTPSTATRAMKWASCCARWQG